jgi:membrane-associated phospholipid phosphatase
LTVDPSRDRNDGQRHGWKITDVGAVRVAARDARHLAAPAVVLVSIWVVLTGVLILAGEGIEHSAAVESMDRSITTFVVAHRTSALDQLMKAVTWTGSWIAALGVSAIVVAFTWKRRLPILAVVAVLAAWLGELLAVTLTKAVVERARPPEAVRLVVAHGWSFPSGHTANAVVVFATAAAVVTFLVHRRIVRFLTWALAILATALVGFSRIELGVHWTTDVVMSMVWTTGWIVVLVVVVRRIRTAGSAARDGESMTDAACIRYCRAFRH